jgi:hypothetical protein
LLMALHDTVNAHTAHIHHSTPWQEPYAQAAAAVAALVTQQNDVTAPKLMERPLKAYSGLLPAAETTTQRRCFLTASSGAALSACCASSSSSLARQQWCWPTRTSTWNTRGGGQPAAGLAHAWHNPYLTQGLHQGLVLKQTNNGPELLCGIGCLAVWLPGCLAVWLSGCLAVWLSRCLAVWLCGISCLPACPQPPPLQVLVQRGGGLPGPGYILQRAHAVAQGLLLPPDEGRGQGLQGGQPGQRLVGRSAAAACCLCQLTVLLRHVACGTMR